MKKLNLSNKKILYLGPLFFAYDQYIINKLRELGAEVTAFEIYTNSFKFRLITKISTSFLQYFKNAYYNKALAQEGYDYVLVRHGYQLTEEFYKKLREINPNAAIINFHWDSLKPEYDYRSIIKYFNKVYSFDYKDCEIYKEVNYLPLFYIDEYSKFQHANENIKPIRYDLLFIGAWRNPERYRLIKLTDHLAKEKNLQFYYYLHLSTKDQKVSIKEGVTPKESRDKLLSHIDILKYFLVSNTIIDFPSSFQSGLTMRTFEALGAGKKLITTNQNIKKEPFYNEEYINIIDTNNIILDRDFIRASPKTSISRIMEDYSIENYIYKLLQE